MVLYIPPFLCLARSLAVLAADENQLRGSIPNCIGNLTSLRLLYLDYNALSSTIPLTLWSLKDLLQLTEFKFSERASFFTSWTNEGCDSY